MAATTPEGGARGTVAGALLPVALELFTRKGYADTSLREIAERLGITKAAIYYHVESKDALLGRIVAPFIEDIHVTLKEAPPEPDELLARYFEVLRRHRELTTLIARDPAVHTVPGVQAELDARLAEFRSRLAGPSATLVDEIRAASAVGALWRPFVHVPGFDADEHGAHVLGAAIAALHSRPVSAAAVGRASS